MELPGEPAPANPVAPFTLDHLEFEKVSFTHLTGASPALSEVSFGLSRGKTIAFVGPSGAGKTTLVKLLVGLYHPENGRILYNGHDGKDVELSHLRSQIGFVTQETQLFSGTIRKISSSCGRTRPTRSVSTP